LEEIRRNTLEVIAQARINASVSATDIVAVGITNQRETTVVMLLFGKIPARAPW
jgi:glycerol kinase